MKKKSTIPAFVILLIAGFVLIASGFQEKGNKGKNEKPQHAKGNQTANDNKNKPVNTGNAQEVKGNQGNEGNAASQGKGNGNNGKGNDNLNNPGKGNNNKEENGSKTKGNEGNSRRDNAGGKDNWYSWTRENFKDRSQIRGKDKVTICHKVNGNEPVTIRVSANAVTAHRNHGDVVGDCQPVKNSIFSDIFQRRRTSYYNELENGQDQYHYSQSVLDYAVMRLTNSRSQLDVMRANNASRADIDRRQATVVELEENVSLLEAALGIAGQLLIERL